MHFPKQYKHLIFLIYLPIVALSFWAVIAGHQVILSGVGHSVWLWFGFAGLILQPRWYRNFRLKWQDAWVLVKIMVAYAVAFCIVFAYGSVSHLLQFSAISATPAIFIFHQQTATLLYLCAIPAALVFHRLLQTSSSMQWSQLWTATARSQLPNDSTLWLSIDTYVRQTVLFPVLLVAIVIIVNVPQLLLFCLKWPIIKERSFAASCIFLGASLLPTQKYWQQGLRYLCARVPFFVILVFAMIGLFTLLVLAISMLNQLSPLPIFTWPTVHLPWFANLTVETQLQLQQIAFVLCASLSLGFSIAWLARRQLPIVLLFCCGLAAWLITQLESMPVLLQFESNQPIAIIIGGFVAFLLWLSYPPVNQWLSDAGSTPQLATGLARNPIRVYRILAYSMLFSAGLVLLFGTQLFLPLLSIAAFPYTVILLCVWGTSMMGFG